MRRILFATDDSPCSRQAVRQGAALLGADACAVRVLSVIPPRAPGELPGVGAHQAAESAQDALDAAIGDLTAAGHTAEGAVRVGDPPTTIAEAARDFGADLIVVGTHGARADSVAEGVLRAAPCGVLIYPVEPCK